MICFRDMTFCRESTCANFAHSCDRALTKEVIEAADKWWNTPGTPPSVAPISMFSERPDCYVKND